MADTTPRFTLPFILPGQAQKELFHNEALVRADLLLHPAVEGPPAATPPADPQSGQIWLVAESGQGDWQGHGGALAAWTAGGWRFASPVPGMMVWLKSASRWIHWSGTAWSGQFPVEAVLVDEQQVVGPRQPEVPSPSGGTLIDSEARASVSALIVALKTHGLID